MKNKTCKYIIDKLVHFTDQSNSFLIKYRSKLYESSLTESFLSLAARNDLDKKDSKYFEYEKRLLWALDENNESEIRNIALTGYYGSGKTSVIKTFQKRNDFNYLNVSLATFQTDGQETAPNDNSSSAKNVEAGILKQIFYKVKDTDIPSSHYDKIRDITISKKTGVLITLILTVLLFDYLFYGSSIISFLTKEGSIYEIIGKIIFLIIICFLAFFLIGRVGNYTINKIGYKNLDIEIAKQTKKGNVLNRFLDELIYIFKKKKYNVVVFEDIDRFNSTQIFTNLRELNYILNNTDIINHKVFFLYAIKDDQFKTSVERTKFFDFIIPVIPVVNFETSVKVFKDLFSQDEQNELSNIIDDLVIYIDDMRLLINIFNEFRLFKIKINNKDLSLEKLLGVVIYKNIEPKDYSLFSRNEGLLSLIINLKTDLIEDLKNKLQSKIDNKTKRLKELENEKIENIKELRKIYILEQLKYLKFEGAFGYFYYEYHYISIEELINSDEYFNHFQTNKIRTYSTSSRNGRHYHFTKKFSDFELDISKKTFEQRQELILNQWSTKSLKSEIESLNNELLQVPKKHLKELISKSDIESACLTKLDIDDKSIKKKEIVEKNKKRFSILYRILKEGYIAEDFIYYLSQFEGLDLTVNDNKFLQNVKNYRFTNFDYKLDNLDYLLNRFSPSDFTNETILNNQLVNKLFIRKSHLLKDERNDVLAILKTESSIVEDFLVQILNKLENTSLFVAELSKSQPLIFERIKKSSKFNDQLKKEYFEAIIKYSNIEVLKEMYEKSDISNDIYSHPNFLSICSTTRNREIISELELIFSAINFEDSRDEDLKLVYEKNAYIITEHNIKGIIKHNLGENFTPDYYKSIYSTIIEKQVLENLNEYISGEKRLQTFVKNIVLGIDENVQENESAICGLLNKPEELLSLELKHAIISKQKTKITKIENINSFDCELILFGENKVSARWDNLTSLYSNDDNILGKNTIVDELIAFLNIDENATQISMDISNITDLGNHSMKIIDKITNTKDLANSSYYKIFQSLSKRNAIRDFSNFEYIPKDKIDILIKTKYIKLTEENLREIIYANLTSQAYLLLKVNENEIITSDEELLEIFDEKLFNLIIERNEFSDKVLSFIINHSSITLLTEESKNKIMKLFLFNSNIKLSNQVKNGLKEVVVDKSQIAKAFNVISEGLENSEVKHFFQSQKDREYQKLSMRGKRPKFKMTSDVNIMLQDLNERGLINKPVLSFINDEKYLRVNKVI